MNIPSSFVDNVVYDPSTGSWLRQARAQSAQEQTVMVSSTQTQRYQLDDLALPAYTTNEGKDLVPKTTNGLQFIEGNGNHLETESPFPQLADLQGAGLEESLDRCNPQSSCITLQDPPTFESKASYLSLSTSDNPTKASQFAP